MHRRSKPRTSSAKSRRSAVAPEHLRTELRGDLDATLRRTLRKEPERRYPTVAAFAADLRRYQKFEPVLAHKESFDYHGAKFVRRNRIPVIAATVALLVLIISGI